MIETILSSEVVVPTATLTLGYIARMIFDRRKLKAENSSAELDADSKAVELYERYAARVESEIKLLKENQVELNNQVAQLRLENTELKIENKTLKSENSHFQREIADLYAKLKELQTQVSNPKKS
jgi:chromosome segregation ATPase